MAKRVIDPRFAPPVYGVPESNAYLRSMKKKALEKINSKPRYLAVCRQRDLGVCLLSYGRRDDAVEVLRFAQDGVSFRSGMNVWDSVSEAAAVAAFISRNESGCSPSDNLRKFVDQPANALFTQPEVYTTRGILAHLDQERARFTPYFGSANVDAAIEAMCWWTSKLIFHYEFAELGFPKDGLLDARCLKDQAEETLRLIREKLEGM